VRNDQATDVSLRELGSVLWRHWKLIGMVAVSSTVLAGVFAFLQRPVYLAEVLLAPVEDTQGPASLGSLAGQFGSLASLAGVDLGAAGSQKEEAIAILNSRRFAADFINEKNLLHVLFEEDWDGEAEAWLRDGGQAPSEWDAFKLFDEDVRRVVVDRASGLVTLQIRWHDPATAMEWANELVRRANDAIRADAIDEAQRSIEYLERELENTSVVELRRGLFQLVEQKISAVMLANVREEYAFKVLDPAVIADEDDFESPNRPVILVAGFLLGLVLGMVAALVLHWHSTRRPVAPDGRI
jgi:uncharacterized protein involved in exopolysaccharide biosynthesis